jgi:hypothetical protein
VGEFLEQMMVRWIEASVSILECDEGHTAPYLTFHGDTDMVTLGIGCLSSIVCDEIVVAELEPAELSDETGLAFQSRINGLLNRDDLRFIRLCGVADDHLPAGTSFRAFRQVYAPPILTFACSKCGGEDATAVKRLTLAQYECGGGKLTVLSDLKLVQGEA